MKALTVKFSLLFFFLSFNALISCSQAQDFEKLSEDKVDEKEIETGKSFINNFYASLSDGGTYDFKNNDATEEVKNAFTPEMQKSNYTQIKAQLGEYESAEYAEAWIQSTTPDYKILRYKGEFSDSPTKVEIRVVLNEANKVAGFFVKPWSDMMN